MSKSNITCRVVHDGTIFSWKGKHGVAEVSTLGQWPWCPVYRDACDMGFGVQGATRKIVFAVSHKQVNERENELEAWVLTSISEPGYTITLFND